MVRPYIDVSAHYDEIKQWVHQRVGHVEILDRLARQHQIRVSKSKLRHILRELNIATNRPRVHDTDALRQRIVDIFNTAALPDKWMHHTLEKEGFVIGKQTLARIRKEMGLYRRDGNYGRGLGRLESDDSGESLLPLNRGAESLQSRRKTVLAAPLPTASETRRSLRSSTRTSGEVNVGPVSTYDGGVWNRVASPHPNPPESKQASSSTMLGKRKRIQATAAAAAVLTESASVRRSPRKTPKTDTNAAESHRKTRRQPAKHIRGSNGKVTIEPPANWERVYEVTTAMRKRVLAPVDVMGCESLAEEHRSSRDQRLQTLIALMLSSQTKDTVTAAAMKNLQQNLPGGLCLEALLQVEPEELNRLIEKVGFHNNKTKYIKAAAVILRDAHNGDIPDTIPGLQSLPGVGPKMAYLCMSAAWDRHEGIGVDVHVHRITNLWGWHKTRTPEQTRGELESWLPRDRWHDINSLLVGLGQTICLPLGRRCWECDLSEEGLCPSAIADNPARRRILQQMEVEVKGERAKEEQHHARMDHAAMGIEIDPQLLGADKS